MQPGVVARHLLQEPDFAGFSTRPGLRLRRPRARHALSRRDPSSAPGACPSISILKKASGGQARRIALAHAFAHDPDVLLLDEPTNHLDVPAIELLEEELTAFRGAALIVSHDRRFLENVATSVAWLRQGTVHTLGKGYAAFEEWAETVEADEEKAFDKLNVQLKAEERWMARGVTARRRRNMGRVRKLLDMRDEKKERRIALNQASSTANLGIDAGAQSGRLVIEAKNLSKTFHTPDGPLPIARDLSLRVMRGDRLGIIGPNGAGKTTLLKLLLGQLAPDAGALRLAKNLDIAYLDQTRASLKPDVTLWDTLTPLGGDQVMVRGHPSTSPPTPRTSSSSPASFTSPSTPCPAVNATASPSPWRWPSLQTSSSSMNRQTISTSRRSICSKTCSANTRARCCWSATTAPSSTTSSPPS